MSRNPPTPMINGGEYAGWWGNIAKSKQTTLGQVAPQGYIEDDLMEDDLKPIFRSSLSFEKWKMI